MNLTMNQIAFLGACLQERAIPEILAEVKRASGVSISKAGAYTMVDRLEDADLVGTKLRDYTNPSGKVVKRRFVKITGKGEIALRHAESIIANLRLA